MKESEKVILNNANIDNTVLVSAEEVYLGVPMPMVIGPNNTNIKIHIHYDKDTDYTDDTIIRYNRHNGQDFGINGIVRFDVDTLDNAKEQIAQLITDELDLPTETSEFSIFSVERLSPTRATYVIVFNDHPLIFGLMLVELVGKELRLSDLATDTELDGFTLDQLEIRG